MCSMQALGEYGRASLHVSRTCCACIVRSLFAARAPSHDTRLEHGLGLPRAPDLGRFEYLVATRTTHAAPAACAHHVQVACGGMRFDCAQGPGTRAQTSHVIYLPPVGAAVRGARARVPTSGVSALPLNNRMCVRSCVSD